MMHPNQHEVTTDVATELIRAQFPEWRELSITPLATTGTMNAIFRIGNDLAARFPLLGDSVEHSRVTLAAEAAAMDEFSAASTVPAPTVVAMGAPGPGYGMPWVVQIWIPGSVVTGSGLAESTVFARDLAALIRSLRAVDTRGRTFTGDGRGGNLHDSDEWMAQCFRESEGLVDVDAARALWQTLADLPRTLPDAMCHCDLMPPNLLVSGEHLVGVIDSGGFSAADPSLDLVVAWHALDGGARAALRDALGCDDLEWARGAAWALQQAMGLVWYYASSNPELAAIGRGTVSRILADPAI
jgi:aminoglycoside phosphotransferase (APT) family kinase protein